MKMNKLCLLGLIASAVLSSCGRNDYNGTYTGTAAAGAGATTSGTYVYGQYNSSTSPDTVTLALNQNGQQVQGTYTAGNGEKGQFYANATSSNRLDGVQLNIQQYQQGSANSQNPYANMGTSYAAYCAGSFYTGSLSATDDARQLQGTLTASGGTSMSNPQCTSKTFTLFKSGNK